MMSEKEIDEPITNKYGTILIHIGECRDCDFELSDNGSYDGYKRVEDTLCRHIGAPGAPCHDFHIKAIYDDGGERRV